MNVRRAPERLQVRANRLWIWAIITQPVFSLVFAGHQPWWALNILFVFAGVTQLLALKYRFGRGKSCWCSAAGHHDLAAESGQLRSGGFGWPPAW
jgi:hypothetical protein